MVNPLVKRVILANNFVKGEFTQGAVGLLQQPFVNSPFSRSSSKLTRFTLTSLKREIVQTLFLLISRCLGE